MGAKGEIEETLVPRASVPLETIEGGGLHGVGPRHFLRSLASLGRGFVQAWRTVGHFRPDVVFLTGGYVSAPVAVAAWLRRCPILVYLPDVEPGRAIKWIGRIATRIAVNVEASRKYLPPKVIVTGYPLRPEFQQDQAQLRRSAREALGIPPMAKALLVFGGSRGSQSINRALGGILERVLAQAHLIHMSGRLDYEECLARRAQLPAEAQARYHLFDYVHEMPQMLAAADLVVARAGAATLAEFPILGLPAILVPYPYAWRYQKVNADYLAERGAAIRLDDGDMPEQLGPMVETLFTDEERLKQMSSRARALAQPNAAACLADLLTKLARNSRSTAGESDHGRH